MFYFPTDGVNIQVIYDYDISKGKVAFFVLHFSLRRVVHIFSKAVWLFLPPSANAHDPDGGIFKIIAVKVRARPYSHMMTNENDISLYTRFVSSKESRVLRTVCILQYYWLRYKCDDCQYDYFYYSTVYGFNHTSVNISGVRRARYTVMIRVYTSYGFGKWAQTTAGSSSGLGPVSNLNARLDSSSDTRVHLSWTAPSYAVQVMWL